MLVSNQRLRVPRSLGEQINVEPTIIVDTREQDPLVFSRLQSERGTLPTGDYSIKGAEHLFAVERKTISDLIGCCTGDRERFDKELLRLNANRFRRLLIVGTEKEIWAGRYRSSIKPQSIMGSLSAWQMRFDCPPVFRTTAQSAAALVERWAYWFARECLIVAINLTKANADTKETRAQ